ncbi:L-threonylcarbamoyladenylate synthase [Roseimarinus sediminis]|uniref:L-threonylcarbamoyladenylate synthase n=1 Tax=Roseimarinus sediminis TaxID=1610899 RepID=UPI003D260004
MSEYYDDIKHALEVLRTGGILLYPADTGWALGCDAANPEAVQRLLKIKQKPVNSGFIVLLENPNFIVSYVDEVPEVAWDLVELAEKPTSIIFDKAKNVAAGLTGPDGSIGIRISREPFTQELLRRFRKPLVATSPKISARKAPATFSEIPDEIKLKADYIVKYRQNDMSKAAPSSIIQLGSSGLIKIVRK